jgi:hypothetical protein
MVRCRGFARSKHLNSAGAFVGSGLSRHRGPGRRPHSTPLGVLRGIGRRVHGPRRCADRPPAGSAAPAARIAAPAANSKVTGQRCSSSHSRPGQHVRLGRRQQRQLFVVPAAPRLVLGFDREVVRQLPSLRASPAVPRDERRRTQVQTGVPFTTHPSSRNAKGVCVVGEQYRRGVGRPCLASPLPRAIASGARVTCYRPRGVPCPQARDCLIENGSGTATSAFELAQLTSCWWARRPRMRKGSSPLQDGHCPYGQPGHGAHRASRAPASEFGPACVAITPTHQVGALPEPATHLLLGSMALRAWGFVSVDRHKPMPNGTPACLRSFDCGSEPETRPRSAWVAPGRTIPGGASCSSTTWAKRPRTLCSPRPTSASGPGTRRWATRRRRSGSSASRTGTSACTWSHSDTRPTRRCGRRAHAPSHCLAEP